LLMPQNKKFFEKIALERIYRLFELAEQEFETHPERSAHYIGIARKVSTRNRARIPEELKASFCKKCNSLLKNGKNCETEKRGTLLCIRCKECGFERKTRA